MVFRIHSRFKEPAMSNPLDENERQKIITATIERLRPAMQADGGDLELAAIEGHKVKVRLKGACAGCGLANETLGWIRRTLSQELGGGPVLVVPAL
jgi:Fe-S cluster biogenesis protein NfuA